MTLTLTLTLAIANYRAGLADFNANAPLDEDEKSDAYAAISYDPPLMVLRAWDRPARDLPEAALALDAALGEFETGDVDTAEALVRAAALYLREVCLG